MRMGEGGGWVLGKGFSGVLHCEGVELRICCTRKGWLNG